MEMNELNEKLQYFLDNKIKIHVDLKDGLFLNGYLVKKDKKNWILKEDKLNEIILFVSDIKKLQQFLKRMNDMKGGVKWIKIFLVKTMK